ncbi:MAG: hypothetical protein JSW15_09260, partial [Deltaproteobacteria bacterium]
TVGGCAGNSWAWHTENDTLEVADPQVLVRDIKVYLASIFRILNAHIYPFDFTQWAEVCTKVLNDYASKAKDLLDISPVLEESRTLHRTLSLFYSQLEKAYSQREKGPERFKKANQCLLELGRILIPVNYTKSERYSHDPAIPIPPFPDLEPVRQLVQLSQKGDEYRFLKTQVVRGRNRVVDALRRARRQVEQCHAIFRREGCRGNKGFPN